MSGFLSVVAGVLVLASLPFASLAAGAPARGGKEDAVAFGPFGPVTIYREKEHPSHVVLFVSGDGGWNLGVVAMARQLASLDALVAGIDIRRYPAALEKGPGKCACPPADFEALGQYLQKRLGFAGYKAPILAGYSSGATLVYAALAQAPPGTFSGAMSLGFCPDRLLRVPRLLLAGGGRRRRPAGAARAAEAPGREGALPVRG